jgi:hypothetical protein
MMIDKNGREIRHGDLIRVPHYTDATTRRKVFMHKLVVKTGSHLAAVDVCDIATHGVVAHQTWLTEDYAAGCEIIDGLSGRNDNGLECWYERPKIKTKAGTGK